MPICQDFSRLPDAFGKLHISMDMDIDEWHYCGTDEDRSLAACLGQMFQSLGCLASGLPLRSPPALTWYPLSTGMV